MLKLSKKSIWQFFQYSVGGLAYFWSAWLIITFSTSAIGLWWSNILGNSVGIVLNFLVQHFWAFGGKQRNLTNSGWKFVVLTTANLFISYLILRLLTGAGIPLWAAQFVSAGFFTIWNWLWYKYWVFAAEPRRSGKQKSSE